MKPERRLKPGALLPRLRPLRLRTVAGRLGQVSRLATALQRLRQCFPAALLEYGPLDDLVWYAVLADLLYRIENEDWFALDWARVNHDWAAGLEEGQDRFDRFSHYLDYVPVRRYGLSTGELARARCPTSLELLRALLIETEVPVVTAELTLQGDLYQQLTHWSQRQRQTAGQQLALIEADPTAYPVPFRSLPILARWACSQSGNPLLDHTLEPDRPETWVSWDDADRLERLKAAWPAAKTILAQAEVLQAWVETDDTHLSHLARFLAGEVGDGLI